MHNRSGGEITLNVHVAKKISNFPSNKKIVGGIFIAEISGIKLSQKHHSLNNQLLKIVDLIHSFSFFFLYLSDSTNTSQPKDTFLVNLYPFLDSNLSYRLLTYRQVALGYIMDVKEIETTTK